MAIDYASLKNRRFERIEHAYRGEDAMLYALALGLPLDPADRRELAFVYERDLKALPTLAVVLGYPGFWMRDEDVGIDWVKILHGEERLTLHAPLAPAGKVHAEHRVLAITDKGAARGAIVTIEKKLFDALDGRLLATVEHVTFCRGNGGYAKSAAESDAALPPLPHVPERAPDVVCALPTSRQAALLYRLRADLNPLHADPEVARAAGFEAPILHGLATYGVAAHAVLRTLCGYDPARLKRFDVRFSAPVYPGETIATEMWCGPGGRVQFRSRVAERDVVVLDHGVAEIGG